MNEPSAAQESSRALSQLGLRREISLLLPLSLLVVLAVTVFALFAYRSSLTLLAAERRAEAERLARAAASALGENQGSGRLREVAPQALGVAVLDARGGVLARSGDIESMPLPAELESASSASRGLSPEMPDRVAGYARLSHASPRYLRVDLTASVLAAQQRALRRLIPVALAASLAALILVVVFVRRAFEPYDLMLEKARAAGGARGASDDEVPGLVATFELALASLGRTQSAPEDDIAALQRALAPSLESGVLLLDRDGAVVALNPAGSEILGAPPPAVGTPLAAAFAANPEVAEALAPAVAGGARPQRQEIEFRRAGEVRKLGFTLHSLRRNDASVRGYLVLFADLTETRRAEEENRIADSLAQLGELTAGLAHELRNSLATLRGYLTLIERRPEEERIADYLLEIRHETDQLQRVLDDFLSFARPGSARLEVVDLEQVVRRAAVDPALQGYGVEIVTEASSRPPKLQGDPQLLERAVRNLLHNAIEAQRSISALPPIRVRLRAGEEGVELTIEDRGAGVPPEVRERLFHPFVTSRTGSGGVGLGLALAHRIISLHGGSLRLDDRPEGGTRTVVEVPGKRATGGNISGPREPRPPGALTKG